MLLILGGILLIALVIIGLNREWELIQELGIYLVCIALILIGTGICIPTNGYKAPVLIEARPLYALDLDDKNQIEQSNTFLIIELFDTSDSFKTNYRYRVSEDGEEIKASEFTQAIIEEIKVPVVEKYKIKPKMSIWTFGLAGYKKLNVIRVSPDQVKYLLTSK